MPGVVQVCAYIPKILFGDKPIISIFQKAKWSGIIPHGFFAIIQKIFVEIGHGKFPDGSVDRFPISQDRVVGFAYRAPAAGFFKQGDNMVAVSGDGSEIQEQGFVSVKPERGCGEVRPFEAMGALGFEGRKGRAAGLALGFKIYRDLVYKILDFRGSDEFLEDGEILSVFCRELLHKKIIVFWASYKKTGGPGLGYN